MLWLLFQCPVYHFQRFLKEEFACLGAKPKSTIWNHSRFGSVMQCLTTQSNSHSIMSKLFWVCKCYASEFDINSCPHKKIMLCLAFNTLQLFIYTSSQWLKQTLSVELMFNVLFMYKQVGIIMLALMDCSLYELSAQPLKIFKEQLKNMTEFSVYLQTKISFSLLSCYVPLCSIYSNSSYICVCGGGQNKIKNNPKSQPYAILIDYLNCLPLLQIHVIHLT